MSAATEPASFEASLEPTFPRVPDGILIVKRNQMRFGATIGLDEALKPELFVA